MTVRNFEDVLAINIGAAAGHAAVGKIAKTSYDKLVAFGNVTSYSMQQLLHACPRKFAIKKLRAHLGGNERKSNTTFAFGHAVGAGVAVFDQTQDLRAAIWAAFLAWDIDLLEEETKGTRKTGKSFHEAVWALYAWRQFANEETDLEDYDVVQVEASLVVDFEDGHYYVAHVDEMLRNKYTGMLRVKENKTTGLITVDPAMYSNSDQGLSYTLIADSYEAAEFEVWYTIYSSATQTWYQHKFVKSASKRAEWIQDQLLQHQQVEQYAELKFFPKRGGSCMQFMRRCEEYETCDISFKRAFGIEFSELPKCAGVDDIRAIEHVDTVVTLSEVVARQRARIGRTADSLPVSSTVAAATSFQESENQDDQSNYFFPEFP